MVEDLILILSGTLLGTAWSILGIYLGSLVIHKYPQAAYAIRGIFLAIATMFHGFLRSGTPRLYKMVLLMLIVCIVSLTSAATAVTKIIATQILYPILMAIGVILVISLFVLPEFSSAFLGQKTIEALDEAAKTLANAGTYFLDASDPKERARKNHLEPAQEVPKDDRLLSNLPKKDTNNRSSKVKNAWNLLSRMTKTHSANDTYIFREGKVPKTINLTDLTNAKGKLRSRLTDCKSAQTECNFELAFSVLPPRDLKSISVRSMTKLVANTIAVIGACESRFAALGDETFNGKEGDDELSEGRKAKERRPVHTEQVELEFIKPKREIEFGNVRLLRYLLRRIAAPYRNLNLTIMQTVEVINASIAYTYVGL